MSGLKFDNVSNLSILSGDSEKCYIKQDVSDLVYYSEDINEEEMREELYELLEHDLVGQSKNIDELKIMLNTPLNMLSNEDRNILDGLEINIVFDYNNVITAEQAIIEAININLEKDMAEMITDLNEGMNYNGASICSGSSNDLANFFTLIADGITPSNFRISISGQEAVVTYQDNIVCTSTIKVNPNQ